MMHIGRGRIEAGIEACAVPRQPKLGGREGRLVLRTEKPAIAAGSGERGGGGGARAPRQKPDVWRSDVEGVGSDSDGRRPLPLTKVHAGRKTESPTTAR